MNLLFVGGGSGGHFFPCIEFIKYCLNKGNKCFYIGGKNKYEDKKKELIPCDFLLLNLHGFNNTISSGIKLMKSYFQNKKIIKKYILENKIDKVILFGNFESLIVGLVAREFNIPYYIHEQNSEFGRSNKILLCKAKKIFTFFNIKFKYKNIYRVGNPRAIKKFHFKKNNKVLVILGSLGASELIEKLIKYLDDYDKNITFVLGENVINNYQSKHKIVSFFDHSKDSFDNYDFIITRGGATTISEIVGYAIPFLIIPSPNVINNHQEKNALSIINHAGGEYLNESKVNKENLTKIIDKYLSDSKLYFTTQVKLYNFTSSNTCERMYELINE